VPGRSKAAVGTAVYARVSRDRADRQSVEEQLAEIEREAKRRDWTIAEQYIDRGKSASKPDPLDERGQPKRGRDDKPIHNRPAYRRLLDDIRAGRVQRLTVYMTDRLYRQPRELEDLIDLVDAHPVEFVTCRSGDLDLTTPEGRAFARTTAAWNRLETERTSVRVRRTKSTRLAEGRWLGGGRRAYGYRVVGNSAGLDVVPDEAEVVREMADRIIRGDTLYAIVSDLNRRGVPTASGGRWSYAGVRSILLGSPNGKKRGTPLIAGGANWSPILDTDRLALVRARWPKAPEGERPGRRRGVLSGVAVCGECGHRMFRSADYYRCNVSNGGCGLVSVKAFTLEHWVVWTTANTAPIGNDPPPDEAVDVEPILARLRELEERAREIEESIVSGEMPVRIGAKAAARLETERQTVEAELASAPGYRRSVPRVDFTKRDEATGLPVEADVGDLRAFVSHFVERVIVRRPPHRRPRPDDRAEIVWRRPEIMLDHVEA
jgi:site-specific DNA recombinase